MNLRIVTNHLPIEDAYAHLVIEKGKKGLGVGSWVVEQKYKYLCTYIDAARSAFNRWPNKVYIDPFCGPGRIQVREESFTRPNGAVTAWLQSLKSKAPFSKILIGDIGYVCIHRYWFISNSIFTKK
ncbi:class I SAM-dependent methyltransferase [Methyloradius palustris]|uniref:Uncharacterized protein n=1 Tax=Methyloradius palustris TaxID=2778876 RepID=A0A8D5JL32_9PROT|nr:hypothetical protein [Methyloradius palustris]BCM24490.1 hypothetical protein ZMTM_07490 [Methyloradius palustris]